MCKGDHEVTRMKNPKGVGSGGRCQEGTIGPTRGQNCPSKGNTVPVGQGGV